jgi:RNAse (barnase) inhibitor barstar
MPDWGALFSSFEGSGVYTAGPGTRTSSIKKTAIAVKLDYSEADLTGTADKKALLEKLAHALDFPDYFGMNWDALNDCLTDMGWKPARGYVVVLKKFTEFAGKCPDEAKTAGDIFAAAAKYWKQKAVPFYIILS